MKDSFVAAPRLVLGTRLNARIPRADQERQRAEADEILRRLRGQPGVILADEVGMGKTYVALAVAYTVSERQRQGPVIVMVPANLIDKWEQDLFTFCDLYLRDRRPVRCDGVGRAEAPDPSALRYGIARHSVELMRILDDPPRLRSHLVFLAQGAMGRSQTDKWIRLALVGEALRRHARGRSRLSQVKRQIHRFTARLISALGEERMRVDGDQVWRKLITSKPGQWKSVYNAALHGDEAALLDDPVPKAVLNAMPRLDLAELAGELEGMPIRARGDDAHVAARVKRVRAAMRGVEQELWRRILARAGWRSPLLVVDEAHHLKNPATQMARQLQSVETGEDLHTGDGAMSSVFDRMLFLTATPFQLGHRELVHVLERFGDVRWDETALGPQDLFGKRIEELSRRLDDSQRSAIVLQQSWSRLTAQECGDDIEKWWHSVQQAPRDGLPHRQRAVVDAYAAARKCRDAAEESLRPWTVRQNKGLHWSSTNVTRRNVIEGAAVSGAETPGGIPIPPRELLPFFLAARSATDPGKDLLGEALCSSYEAFRRTRSGRGAERDCGDDDGSVEEDMSHAAWYLREFDRALKGCGGLAHPKVTATVRTAVDLWEAGEKVLIFAFYRRTCRALRVHISAEMERRIREAGTRKLAQAGRGNKHEDLDKALKRIQKNYFDSIRSPGRRSVDEALKGIMSRYAQEIRELKVTARQQDALLGVMRRYLRASSTLVRSFPIAEVDSLPPADAVSRLLGHADGSGITWDEKFSRFIDFIVVDCMAEERNLYLEAAERIQTGGIRVEDGEDDAVSKDGSVITIANVQIATGTTRRDARVRLMRSFNTPFFPDVLVCSQVMGEGVDLQRFCCHVIHHDLAWNPSTIEQRTGRLDRLGSKAEGRRPINVYLPYLAGAADERQYRVMSDRERWFRVVMGEEKVSELITPDSTSAVALPESIAAELSFHLGVVGNIL